MHPNDHPFDSDLIQVNDDSRVIGVKSKSDITDIYYRNLVNAAFYILTPEVLKCFCL